MNRDDLKKRIFKEWAYLVFSLAAGLGGASLVFFVLPGTIPTESYIDFYDRTGLALGDFVFCAVPISVYLVRVILWSLKRANKK